ncbi:hypothetical protein [Pseudanabaena sp. UWO310]|uniref:hypothetical protein n=1 Tax=Pseudanabaena sp. UWO310 TaxID=2480795 RepID=UPI001160BD29|nr:hypothetical protein [Pseudanabaena sp. UWO310]TYQ24872.1 hypothetical protein PseudUWO310_20170 [Pseudanabaena sp. UWO310]
MSLQYVTDQQGEKVGVVLDIATYNRLIASVDSELLQGLSIAELEALAESKLAIDSQQQLSEMLTRNSENNLSDREIDDLDLLLMKVDQLNILKTRARYTLKNIGIYAKVA